MDKYKELSVKADVTVSLPAHVWIGFIAAYNSTRWISPDASAIGYAAMQQMLDPVYIKEQEAEHEQHHDTLKSLSELFGPGRLSPDDPRNDT